MDCWRKTAGFLVRTATARVREAAACSGKPVLQFNAEHAIWFRRTGTRRIVLIAEPDYSEDTFGRPVSTLTACRSAALSAYKAP